MSKWFVQVVSTFVSTRDDALLVLSASWCLWELGWCSSIWGAGIWTCATRCSSSTQWARPEGTGKAEIMEGCCCVCTEQTEALYTGSYTLICIIQTQQEEEGEWKRKKNKMRQEKARGKGTEKAFFPSNFSLSRNTSSHSIIAFYFLVI